MKEFKKIVFNKNSFLFLLFIAKIFHRKNKKKNVQASKNSSNIENKSHQENLTPSTTDHKPMFPSPLIIATLTALFYTQGRAYYTGYFSFFDTSPSVFNLDLLDYYWGAYQAWFLIGDEILNFSANLTFEKLATLLLLLTILLSFSYSASLILTILSRYTKKTASNKSKRSHAEHGLLKESLRNMSIGASPIIATFFILIFFSTFVVLLSSPFYLLGKHSAEQKYIDGNTTYLDISSDEKKEKLITIHCSSSKCIIIENDHFGITSLPENYAIRR